MDQLLGTRVRGLPANYGNYFRFPLTKQDAEIGVEFEIEGNGLPAQEDLLYHWKVEHDGSLRGPSAEYVLRVPVSVEYFESKALPYLTKACHKKKSRLAISGRCSTHVHINTQYMYIYQVILFAALYYLFEELTVAFTGPNRKGSLFCVGASESSVISDSITNACDDFISFINTQDRYASVNFKSLNKYGSLEFRSLKGTLDQEEVMAWITFLTKLRDFSISVKPEEVPEILGKLSAETPYTFLSTVLKDTSALRTINAYFHYDKSIINDLIYKGIDKVQGVFYEHKWHTLELGPVVNTSFAKEAERILDMQKRSLNTHNMIRSMSGRLGEEFYKIAVKQPVIPGPKKAKFIIADDIPLDPEEIDFDPDLD